MPDIVITVNNANLDPGAVTDLYALVGWNKDGHRTSDKTQRALNASVCHVSAMLGDQLVGFGRISGDEYAAQIADVITHPDYRQQGIATEMMRRLLEYAGHRVFGLVLIDGSGLNGFYERFGFTSADPTNDRLMYWTNRK